MKPRTLASRLLAKHGRLRAIRKAFLRCMRYRAVVEGEPHVTHPARWLVWTCTLAHLLETTQAELVASMQRMRTVQVRRVA